MTGWGTPDNSFKKNRGGPGGSVPAARARYRAMSGIRPHPIPKPNGSVLVFAQVMSKFLVFYEMADGAMTKVMQLFPQHRARLDAFHERGVCLGAGPLGDPPDGALGIFTTREAANEFVEGDPFVKEGAVARVRVVEWRAVFI